MCAVPLAESLSKLRSLLMYDLEYRTDISICAVPLAEGLSKLPSSKLLMYDLIMSAKSGRSGSGRLIGAWAGFVWEAHSDGLHSSLSVELDHTT